MLRQLRTKLILRAQEGRFAHLQWLRPCSGLWAWSARVRHRLYDQGIFTTHRLPIPVVSVGGLTAGGSGKTPLVQLLAQALKSFGPIAILSRGYRRKESGLPLGDEATLLARRLPDVRVLVDRDRVQAGRRALLEGAKLLILDDGFQYRRLHRDFELLAVDGANPFGFHAFLPRGLLRDSPSRLQRADLLFVNGETAAIFPQQQPLVHLRPKIKRIVGMQGEEATLAGRRGGLFCAIANPERFCKTAKEAGLIEVERLFLPDHDPILEEELALFAKRCQGARADCLVCTEKDAVKISAISCPLPIFYLEMELEIVSGKSVWENLIEKIAAKMNHS